MKLIFTIAIVATASFSAISSAQAGDPRPGYNGDYCKPYVVSTHKISSCREKRMGYDKHGACYYYYVTIVTYKDVYNTGATSTYTKTFRA